MFGGTLHHQRFLTAQNFKICTQIQKKHDTSTDANNVLADDAVMPRLFFVVARTSEEGWQQLSVGLPTYERAVAFRDEPFTKKRYPYAFVVCTINEV